MCMEVKLPAESVCELCQQQQLGVKDIMNKGKTYRNGAANRVSQARDQELHISFRHSWCSGGSLIGRHLDGVDEW